MVLLRDVVARESRLSGAITTGSRVVVREGSKQKALPPGAAGTVRGLDAASQRCYVEFDSQSSITEVPLRHLRPAALREPEEGDEDASQVEAEPRKEADLSAQRRHKVHRHLERSSEPAAALPLRTPRRRPSVPNSSAEGRSSEGHSSRPTRSRSVPPQREAPAGHEVSWAEEEDQADFDRGPCLPSPIDSVWKGRARSSSPPLRRALDGFASAGGNLSGLELQLLRAEAARFKEVAALRRALEACVVALGNAAQVVCRIGTPPGSSAQRVAIALATAAHRGMAALHAGPMRSAPQAVPQPYGPPGVYGPVMAPHPGAVPQGPVPYLPMSPYAHQATGHFPQPRPGHLQPPPLLLQGLFPPLGGVM